MKLCKGCRGKWSFLSRDNETGTVCTSFWFFFFNLFIGEQRKLHVYFIFIKWQSFSFLFFFFFSEFLNVINLLQQREYLWPDNMDLQGAALGLLRIVEIYKISLNALASGKFLGTNCAPLTVDQFMTIANQAQDMDMHWEAIKWYNYTIRTAQGSTVMASLVTRAYRQMADALYKVTKKTCRNSTDVDN